MTVLTWEALELKPEEIFRAMGYGGVKKEIMITAAGAQPAKTAAIGN
ncbi:hypothetical protein JCM15765_35780 [Paradesulfitobacterium aromaticivorans]